MRCLLSPVGQEAAGRDKATMDEARRRTVWRKFISRNPIFVPCWKPWTDGREESCPVRTEGSQPGKSLLVSWTLMQGRRPLLHVIRMLLLDEMEKGCVKLK